MPRISNALRELNRSLRVYLGPTHTHRCAKCLYTATYKTRGVKICGFCGTKSMCYVRGSIRKQED